MQWNLRALVGELSESCHFTVEDLLLWKRTLFVRDQLILSHVQIGGRNLRSDNYPVVIDLPLALTQNLFNVLIKGNMHLLSCAYLQSELFAHRRPEVVFPRDKVFFNVGVVVTFADLEHPEYKIHVKTTIIITLLIHFFLFKFESSLMIYVFPLWR